MPKNAKKVIKKIPSPGSPPPDSNTFLKLKCATLRQIIKLAELKINRLKRYDIL